MREKCAICDKLLSFNLLTRILDDYECVVFICGDSFCWKRFRSNI